MAFPIDVNAVIGEGVFLIGHPFGGVVGGHGGVGIDDGGDLVFLGEDPAGVGCNDVAIVVAVGFFPVEFGGVEVLRFFVCDDIEGGRGDEDEFCAGGADLFDEGLEPALVGFEAGEAEGMVDAVVHAVAGDDEIGFCLLKGAGEALVDIGSGEGVFGFGESGDTFRGEAGGDDFRGVAVEMEGGLEVNDVVAGGGDGVAEDEDAMGGEDGVGGFFDVPDFFEDGDDAGVELDEGGAVVGGDVVFAEVGLGCFGEVFHLVGHAVGGTIGDAEWIFGIAGALGEVGEFAGGFGFLKGGEDGGVVIAEDVVVVGMREFVEGEVGHAAGFLFEVEDVGELDGLGHFDGEAVVFEPVGAGVMAGSGMAVFRGGEVERDLFEVVDDGGGDAVDDVLELVLEEVEGAGCLFGMFLPEVLMDEDGPADEGVGEVSFGGGEAGVPGGAEVGGEGVAVVAERLSL